MGYTKIRKSRELRDVTVPNLPGWVPYTNDLKDDIVTVQTNLTSEIASSVAGNIALATGDFTGTVTHGLVSTPVSVVLTADTTGDYWLTNVGSTGFMVNRGSTGAGPATVYYKAEI